MVYSRLYSHATIILTLSMTVIACIAFIYSYQQYQHSTFRITQMLDATQKLQWKKQAAHESWQRLHHILPQYLFNKPMSCATIDHHVLAYLASSAHENHLFDVSIHQLANQKQGFMQIAITVAGSVWPIIQWMSRCVFRHQYLLPSSVDLIKQAQMIKVKLVLRSALCH